ncbi:MAG: N-acetyl-alpha-D-glucosaminyl L-malate synthase BshA [Bernardetiaceae bacterium]
MKIGVVCYPTYGGSGVVATELGKAIAKRGHQVHFITYDQPTRLDFFSPHLFFHQVDIRTYPLFKYPPYELALASKMVEVMRSERLDLIHVHYAIPHASAAYMAKQILKAEGIEMPFVTTLHGTDITLVGKEKSFAPAVTFSINASDAVTAVSDSLRKDTYDYFDVQRSIEVIPNFIDLSRFKRQKKEHFKRAICPNGERLLIHTSNFRRVKRVDDVARIFCQIRKQIPAKLLLVGDGPERPRVEKLLLDLDCTLQDDVRFLGPINEIEEVLSIADLFLMPSETESFGLAALEAMACEVPVISSNTGGLPELNVHGTTGFMSKVGDVDDMVKNALIILDEANLPTFKRNALEHAKKFDIKHIVTRYEAIYDQTLNKALVR